MAMAAVVGPPPGLAEPKTEIDDIHKEGKSAPIRSIEVRAPAPKSSRYETRFMLALSSSPLVAPPNTMPALSQWYGDWEPYHFRAPHGSQSHGLPYSPMGSIGSGTRAERHGRGAGGAGENYRDKERNGEDADGFHGGVMRDGGLITSRRDQQGARYRSKFEERDSDLAPIRIDKRYPASGKNPFGQVSASGTFKPAGKDGLELGQDRKHSGRMGRDRDPPSAGYSDDRSRGARNGRDPRDRRRGGQEEGDDDEEWESVPKSPESERRSKASLGEAAMEWRRPTGKLSGKGGLPSGRERERDTGRKTSFPAWMAEESEPSWMSEGQDDSEQYQMGGGSSSKGQGKEAGGPPRLQDDDVDVDVSGMDSIQAFKAQMKERERRERERNNPGGASASAQAAGPPPGLEKRAETNEQDADREGMAALHSVGMNQQDKSAAALFDNFASSAKQRQQEKQQQQIQQQIIQGNSMEGNREDSIDQVLPSRSSRFARFFDGKPQAAALAAQQKQMEASHRGGNGGGDEGPIHSPATDSGSGGNLADLFKGMSTEKSYPSEGNGGAPAAPPGLQRNPSEADVQGMQKIMALLSSGGGPKSYEEALHSAKLGRPPGPPPSMPPGINLSPSGQVGERDSHSHQQQHHHQGNSPTSPLQQQSQPHQQIPSSWANALTSPRQNFDSHSGSYPTSPPPTSQQNSHQQQQPFRPPFGIDPRLLARGPPPPQGMPPQFGSPPPPPPPPGSLGRGGMPPNFGIPPFPAGVRPPPPMPPLPPQLQQHMMTLPPQAQHQLLMQHLQHHGLAHNGFGGPPPQQSSQQQQQLHHLSNPGQVNSGNGGSGTSPLPPYLSSSPASNSNANQSAQLMALLGQSHGGNSPRN